jgi:Ca2+-dependent lipid-binding protein
VKNTLDPVWRPFQLKNITLAVNDDAQFRINVIDWDANGSHDPIGHILISFKQFAEAIEKRQPFKIIHYKGKAKDVGTSAAPSHSVFL